MTKKQLKQLKQHIIKTGGATIDADGHIMALSRGYMVSIEGFEKITTLKRLNRRMLRAHILHAIIMCNAYIGFWMDGNKLYIDLSKNIEDKAQAIREGLNNKQLAIYDCATGDCIRLK